MPHVIRLRSPWALRLLSVPRPFSEESLARKLPGDAAFMDLLRQLHPQPEPPPAEAAARLAAGQVDALLLTRFFNQPTNLATTDQVTLSLPVTSLACMVRVNDQTLLPHADAEGSAEETRFALTDPLQRRNRIDLVIDLRPTANSPTDPSGPKAAQRVLAIVEHAHLLIDSA